MPLFALQHPTIAGCDRGDMVLGWLIKLTLALGVFGTLGFDAISIAVAHAGASDDGTYAAHEAALVWQDKHDVFAAFDRAGAAAEEKNPANEVIKNGFQIDADGTVHLKMERTAKTWVVRRIDRIAPWAEMTQESNAGPGS